MQYRELARARGVWEDVMRKKKKDCERKKVRKKERKKERKKKRERKREKEREIE